ncbi:hypothetical protein BV25DRAFT_1919363 [Artomyces pyxidatus]|uniref:Uncharacterized protein n=1 Tax=Artomyces pyxidatus TaxID=48021 RepID=A0ACB8SQ19_9AGAM|nr:hypothetical protein BV25DRAFT_1919363 [Artomyces pyxidatus]
MAPVARAPPCPRKKAKSTAASSAAQTNGTVPPPPPSAAQHFIPSSLELPPNFTSVLRRRAARKLVNEDLFGKFEKGTLLKDAWETWAKKQVERKVKQYNLLVNNGLDDISWQAMPTQLDDKAGKCLETLLEGWGMQGRDLASLLVPPRADAVSAPATPKVVSAPAQSLVTPLKSAKGKSKKQAHDESDVEIVEAREEDEAEEEEVPPKKVLKPRLVKKGTAPATPTKVATGLVAPRTRSQVATVGPRMRSGPRPVMEVPVKTAVAKPTKGSKAQGNEVLATMTMGSLKNVGPGILDHTVK